MGIVSSPHYLVVIQSD
ncbi:hypothetical protein CFP56_016622 [Quercus suber]|uniref:Uncharacterized protein n=1 Tax=Quercus suber TaxID=58331 RepID=A0AAW0KPY3_QUESU